jgi:glucoamylase
MREAGKVIKNDLEEVAGGWWKPGFDLWEEV